jgi:hypothetical protein
MLSRLKASSSRAHRAEPIPKHMRPHRSRRRRWRRRMRMRC